VFDSFLKVAADRDETHGQKGLIYPQQQNESELEKYGRIEGLQLLEHF
jgi:hypothetical protein